LIFYSAKFEESGDAGSSARKVFLVMDRDGLNGYFENSRIDGIHDSVIGFLFSGFGLVQRSSFQLLIMKKFGFIAKKQKPEIKKQNIFKMRNDNEMDDNEFVRT
jgi:hypothetical protein